MVRDEFRVRGGVKARGGVRGREERRWDAVLGLFKKQVHNDSFVLKDLTQFFFTPH